MISRREAAAMLGMSEQSVTNWVNGGILRGHLVGRALMVDRDSISTHFDSLKDLADMEKNIASMKARAHEEEHALRERLKDLSSCSSVLGMADASPSVLKPLVRAILEIAGEDVLNMREHDILAMVTEGWALDVISEKYSLTKARILQICHKAVRKIACMKSWTEQRRELRGLKKENETLTAGMRALQVRIADLERQLSDRSMKENGDENQNPGSMTLLLNTRLCEFNLTIRCMNILRAEGIDTLEDLVRCRRTDLLKFRNLGKKTLAELDDLLESLNLSFGMDVNTIINDDMQALMKRKSDGGRIEL